MQEPRTRSTPPQHSWVRRAGRGAELEKMLQKVPSVVVLIEPVERLALRALGTVKNKLNSAVGDLELPRRVRHA